MRWDVFFVFFIKQKTAYEWRISDWSSDVCSSDLDLLARHGAALCVHDLLADHPWERTTDWAYVRFHGPRALEQPYHGAYGPAGLAGPADRLGEWLDDGCDVYARSEEHTSELQSLMRNSYAGVCLTKKKQYST